MATEREVWTFFYGSYMNLEVLEEIDYVPRHYEPARTHGFPDWYIARLEACRSTGR